MNAVLATLSIPFRVLLRWLRGSLLGRYVRALFSSARMSLAVLGGLVAAIVGLSAFSNPEVEVDATSEAIPVVARPAHPRALALEIHVFGRVENPNTTELRAATLAYVSVVNVLEGQTVAAGDVLMRLDDRDAQLSVQHAEADWQGSVLKLERLVPVAPFDGTIIQLSAAIGARIDAGQTVMTLFNANSQQVRVSLPEYDASALQIAQENGAVVIASARVADRWVTLDLLDIGSQVRSGRAGTEVIFAAPDDTELALGRAVDVKITLSAQEGLIEVPLQGVYADRIVYTVESDMLKAVNVERVGIREDEAGNMTLLVRADDLREGDPVVISSLSRASTGALVKILASEDRDTVVPIELLGMPEAVAAR
ncbi:MAG: multidrug efflux pump subunit AcrA (membrane-fusion protein) [Halieaceae bacterium]|jgi:multidrug efflux pump subunit AcrA (membrane-fusion protein)